MSATPTPTELADERAALIGSDALLSDLVRQRGDAKICYDEEDGWFVQFQWCHYKDEWVTLDLDQQRHLSPSAAIYGAVLAHNDEVRRIRQYGGCSIHDFIPDNRELSPPRNPDNG